MAQFVRRLCNHMQGQLGDGDIEELDGVTCIRCPAHGRRVRPSAAYALLLPVSPGSRGPHTVSTYYSRFVSPGACRPSWANMSRRCDSATQFDLASGRQIATDLDGRLCASAEAEQRVHQTQRDGDGWIW